MPVEKYPPSDWGALFKSHREPENCKIFFWYFYLEKISFVFSPEHFTCFQSIYIIAYLQQNNLFKVREGKYQARINALETLVAGTTEENEVPSILMDLDTHSPIIRA